jgi:hypothetical protein
MHAYEVRPRNDHRGVDLISDALPFSCAPAKKREAIPPKEDRPKVGQATGLCVGL